MKKTAKRFLSLFLALILAFGMMSALTMTAGAVEISSPILPLGTNNGVLWVGTSGVNHHINTGSYSAIDWYLHWIDNVSENRGKPVYAVEDGTIVGRFDSHGQVTIEHTKALVTTDGYIFSKWYSTYTHMTDVIGKNNVKKGEMIGKVGGKAYFNLNYYSPHLHFQINSTSDYYSTHRNAISPYYIKWSNATSSNFKWSTGPAFTEKLLNWKPANAMGAVKYNGTPNPTPLKAGPTNVKLSAAQVGIGIPAKLTWTGVDGATSYEYSVNNGSTWKAATSGVSLPEVNTAGTYTYRVRAKNGATTPSPVSDPVTLTVKPNVKLTYTDWNGTVLETRNVVWGENATPYSVIPKREGYDFKWFEPREGEKKVTENRTLEAKYEKKSYIVKFFGKDGKQLGKDQTVYYGDAASPPTPPEIEDFTFVDWSTNEHEAVKSNLNITASYIWSNFAVPIQTEIISAVREEKDYKIGVKLTNQHHTDRIRGRMIVSVKTSDGKVVESSIIPFSSIAPGATYTDNISVLTDELGFKVEVNVIGIQGDGNSSAPLSTFAEKTINMGDPWGPWGTQVPPAGVEKQSRTEYRTRTRTLVTNSSPSMSGWSLVSTSSKDVWGYNGVEGTYSSWQDGAITATATRRVFTQTVNTGTQYRYSHWRNGSLLHPIQYNSSYVKHTTAWLSSPLPWWGTSSYQSTPMYGLHNAGCGCGNVQWYNPETRNTTKTQYRYQNQFTVYSYTHEQLSNWTEWTPGTPPAYSDTLSVAQRTAYRQKVADWEPITQYNYKRYRFENLRTGQIMFDYTSDWADSMGWPGEWQDTKTQVEMTLLRTTPEGVAEYGSSQEDKWFKSDINGEGNVKQYVTTESREDTSGIKYDIVGRLPDAPGKKATLMVYHGTNVDPTANQIVHISQITLDAQGNYSYSFVPKFPVGYNGTGDFIVVISLEGSTVPIYITTIEALKPSYSVTFIEENGTVIDTQRVVEGQTAIMPDAPQKTGYNFVGWSSSITNIRTDMTIVARYEKKEYYVVFINWDDEEFATKTFKHGDSITTAEIPEKFGGVFEGWQSADGKLVDTVTGPMVLTAKYGVSSHTVRFYDADGKLLDTQVAQFGESVIAPDAAATQGNQVFRFWSTGTGFVSEDMDVYPVYGYAQTVETPVATIKAGGGKRTAALTCATPGAKIYYLEVPIGEEHGGLDYFDDPFEFGENGELINGTPYTSPVELSDDSLLYFIAVKDDMNNSETGISGFYDDSVAGDLDGDLSVDISDIVMLRNWIMEGNPSEERRSKADLDGDGIIDISDIVFLRNSIMR